MDINAIAQTLEDGAEDLRRRALIGEVCMARAYGVGIVPEADRETSASDAISNILTALYGPAGETPLHGRKTDDLDAQRQAAGLLSSAYQSWLGDAEDYTRKDSDA